MEQYINKSDIVAEIESYISKYKEIVTKTDRNDPTWVDSVSIIDAKVDVLQHLLSFLNTLEVKEVDLENLFQALPEKIADEKSHQIYELSVYHYDGECVVDYVGELDHDSLYSFGGNTLYEAIEKAWNWLRENSTGG